MPPFWSTWFSPIPAFTFIIRYFKITILKWHVWKLHCKPFLKIIEKNSSHFLMRSNKPVSCNVCVDSLFPLMHILQCQDVINFEDFLVVFLLFLCSVWVLAATMQVVACQLTWELLLCADFALSYTVWEECQAFAVFQARHHSVQ